MTVRTWTYEESIQLLEDLYHRPLIPSHAAGLDRIGRLLLECGNPHREFRAVHIAGTTGKGSTTTMIGCILQSAGYQTGFFRSPHLKSYRERIAVDGADISPDSWEECFGVVWPIVEAMTLNVLPSYDLGRPSFFEVMFAMACVHFRRLGVEWGAIETGLGGRLDATNTLQSDVSVITNVSLEHTQVLGDTVEAIAREKAAIVKTGSDAVYGDSGTEVAHVIRARARDVGSRLLEVGQDVTYSILQSDVQGQIVKIVGNGVQVEVALHLAGDFQASNAAAAFAAVLALRDRGVPITTQHIVEGLTASRMPGRFELASLDPIIVLDGAHNPAGVTAAAHALRRSLPGKRLILVFAAMADKDVASMAATLAPIIEKTYVTKAPGSQRSAETAELSQAFGSAGSVAYEVPDAAEALQQALSNLDQESALVVAGSLYLVGYAREYFQQSGIC